MSESCANVAAVLAHSNVSHVTISPIDDKLILHYKPLNSRKTHTSR
jgi:hypothetical protein